MKNDNDPKDKKLSREERILKELEDMTSLDATLQHHTFSLSYNVIKEDGVIEKETGDYTAWELPFAESNKFSVRKFSLWPGDDVELSREDRQKILKQSHEIDVEFVSACIRDLDGKNISEDVINSLGSKFEILLVLCNKLNGEYTKND